ncbi:MAG: hypothetical protein IKS15_00720 [Opitutales bacterium]|nr:hypothetical protein [Opitutales bacterium]
MTIQFLILRIQSILDGKANASDAQLRAIASEYMRICQNAERKLLHCASLIRAGRDYAAFQVAETNPMLLETLNELIFARLEDWRNFCAIHSLPCPSPFDENQIALAKALYTREISQNHPLYRDYRRAMRLRNYTEALAIISTIVKVNGTNSEAKNELEKLQKRIANQKFDEARQAAERGDEAEAIKIASSIREYADDIFANNEEWQKLSSKIDAYETQTAAGRIADILVKLRNPDLADDFRKILAYAAEIDVLVSKFELPLEKSDAEFLRAQTKRALAMQDEAIAAEAKAQACLELAAEIEHPSDLPAKQALAKILSLRKKADGSLEEKIAKKISLRVSALRLKIAMSRLKKAAVLCAAACAVVWAFMEAQKRERKNVQYRAALNSMSAIENMQNTKNAIAALQKFEKDFQTLCAAPEFADKIESAKKSLEIKAGYLDRLNAVLAEAEKFDQNSGDPIAWLDLKNKIAAADEQAGVLEGAEQAAAKMKIAEAQNALSAGIAKKRAANAAKISALISEAERELAQVDAHNSKSLENIAKAEEAVASARKMAENPSVIFAITPERAEKLQEVAQELDDKAALIGGFEEAFRAIKNAASAEEYFEALENLSKSPSLSQADAASIAKILGAKDAILFEVYGGIVDLETAKAAPEKFRTPALNFYESPEIGEVFEGEKDGKTLYFFKKPEERNRVWQGGGEIIQKANVIADAGGSAKEETFKKLTIKNRPVDGSILQGIKLSKEADMAKKIVEIAEEKSLAQALVYAANSDASPIFKAFVEKKILDLYRKAPIESGFAFSKTLQDRAKKVDAISKGLELYSWIFAAAPRVKFVENELYKEKLADPTPEAEAMKAAAQKSAQNPMRLAGYADFNGAVAKKSQAEKLYALNINGEFSEITEIKKPAKFSPIFEKSEE